MINIPLNFNLEYIIDFFISYVLLSIIVPFLIAKAIYLLGKKRNLKFFKIRLYNSIYCKYMIYVVFIYFLCFITDLAFQNMNLAYYRLVLSIIFQVLLLVLSLLRLEIMQPSKYKQTFFMLSVITGFFLFARSADFIIIFLLIISNLEDYKSIK